MRPACAALLATGCLELPLDTDPPDGRVQGGACADVDVHADLQWTDLAPTVSGDAVLEGHLTYDGDVDPGIFDVRVLDVRATTTGWFDSFTVTFTQDDLAERVNDPAGVRIDGVQVTDACGARTVPCTAVPCALIRLAPPAPAPAPVPTPTASP